MKKVKKRPKQFVFKIVSIVLVAFSIYLLAGVVNELSTMVNLKKRAEAAEVELNQLKDENAELISKKEKLEDPNYVQSFARGNYMFSKDGEQIFFFPDDNKTE